MVTKYPTEQAAVLAAKRAGRRIRRDEFGTLSVSGSGRTCRLVDAGADGWQWLVVSAHPEGELP
jgi:hypothetical protein